MRSSRKNRKYIQRSYLELSLSLGNLAMIFLSVLITLLGFHHLLIIHMRETILISELKTNQIRSQTIAQLKQFDLTLTNNDLWSATHTLSDLISDPDTYQVDYYDSRENVNRHQIYGYDLGLALHD